MEKLKVTLIIILAAISIMLLVQNNTLEKENSLLKSTLYERSLVLRENPISTTTISDNHSEVLTNNQDNNSKVSSKIFANNSVVFNEVSITEFESNQENSKNVPFKDQKIDYEWATTVETAVNDVFITSELLEKFSLENVECRSSTCEVRMTKGQEDTFHQSALVLFALEEIGIKHQSLNLSTDSEEGMVVFYFSKHDT